MPPLPNPEPPILGAVASPAWHPAHPSPTVDGLRLEVLSPREAAYWGGVIGRDRPEVIYPLGWGEWGVAGVD